MEEGRGRRRGGRGKVEGNEGKREDLGGREEEELTNDMTKKDSVHSKSHAVPLYSME